METKTIRPSIELPTANWLRLVDEYGSLGARRKVGELVQREVNRIESVAQRREAKVNSNAPTGDEGEE